MSAHNQEMRRTWRLWSGLPDYGFQTGRGLVLRVAHIAEYASPFLPGIARISHTHYDGCTIASASIV